MGNITWTDVLLLIVLNAIGVVVIVTASIHMGMSPANGKFGLIIWMWCVGFPLLFAKLRWFGPERKKK